MNKKLLLPLSLLAITTSSHAAISALSGTGWTHDVIIEAGAAGGTTPAENMAGGAAATDGTIALWRLYENGWSNSTQGLNSTGAYTGTAGAGSASYQMQAYNAKNVILDNGTFTLDSAGQFTTINFLVTNQTATNGFTATVNYADATTDVGTFTGVDWTFPTTDPKVVSGHGLNNSTTGAYYTGNLFMTERSMTVDSAKVVNSITFATTSGVNAIHAVSAEAVPEPSSTALLGLGGLALILRRRK